MGAIIRKSPRKPGGALCLFVMITSERSLACSGYLENVFMDGVFVGCVFEAAFFGEFSFFASNRLGITATGYSFQTVVQAKEQMFAFLGE